MLIFLNRSLVSASQDGKLIVWDGYTTNKVRWDKISFTGKVYGVLLVAIGDNFLPLQLYNRVFDCL